MTDIYYDRKKNYDEDSKNKMAAMSQLLSTDKYLKELTYVIRTLTNNGKPLLISDASRLLRANPCYKRLQRHICSCSRATEPNCALYCNSAERNLVSGRQCNNIS